MSLIKLVAAISCLLVALVVVFNLTAEGSQSDKVEQTSTGSGGDTRQQLNVVDGVKGDASSSSLLILQGASSPSSRQDNIIPAEQNSSSSILQPNSGRTSF